MAGLERVGPYLIDREIGRGGMGVVYLARDERLDRDVAIKCLALDHADGTLWFNYQNQSQHTFHQFSKDGAHLSGETFPDLEGFNILGGEYQFVDSCPADLDEDGDADADDFFAYLDAFATGGLETCDVDGDCDADDFFGYLDLFAQGC